VLDKLDVHAVTDVRQVLELALAPATSAASEVPVAA
jgi:ATP-dependent Lon protease